MDDKEKGEDEVRTMTKSVTAPLFFDSSATINLFLFRKLKTVCLFTFAQTISVVWQLFFFRETADGIPTRFAVCEWGAVKDPARCRGSVAKAESLGIGR